MKDTAGNILIVLKGLSDRVNRFVEAMLIVIASGMSVLVSVQVISRYFFNHSLFWSEEVGRICLVWITFLGGSAVYKRHGHPRIDFFVKHLPSRLRRRLRLFVLVLSLAFFAGLVWYGIAFAEFASIQKTTALGLPLTIPYAILPVSGALFLLHGVVHLFELLRDPGE